MSWRLTFALAAATLLAVIVAYRDVLSENPDATWSWLLSEPLPTPPGADIEHLLDFAPAEVTALRIDHDGKSLAAQRDDSGWSGFTTAKKITDYLTSLQELAVIRRLDDGAPADLAQYGLAPPRTTVELQRSDGPPIRLHLGDANPTGTGAYCRRGDSGPVIVTGALARWDLDKLLR
jgi:hypothetical protein